MSALRFTRRTVIKTCVALLGGVVTATAGLPLLRRARRTSTSTSTSTSTATPEGAADPSPAPDPEGAAGPLAEVLRALGPFAVASPASVGIPATGSGASAGASAGAGALGHRVVARFLATLEGAAFVAAGPALPLALMRWWRSGSPAQPKDLSALAPDEKDFLLRLVASFYAFPEVHHRVLDEPIPGVCTGDRLRYTRPPAIARRPGGGERG